MEMKGFKKNNKQKSSVLVKSEVNWQESHF